MPRPWEALSSAAVHPSICLSHAHSPKTVLLGLWILWNTNRKPHADQRSSTATGSCGNARACHFTAIGVTYRQD